MKTERYTSPDGRLVLIVAWEDDGDTYIGFEGYPWHTHGDILASIHGMKVDAAIAEFVEATLADRLAIAVQKLGGIVEDVWVADDIDGDSKYEESDETIEHRYWSGRPATNQQV